jgi:hypothetical protein
MIRMSGRRQDKLANHLCGLLLDKASTGLWRLRGVCIGALGIVNCSFASGRSVADTLTCVRHGSDQQQTNGDKGTDYHLCAIKCLSVELEGLEICIRIAKFYRSILSITRPEEGVGVQSLGKNGLSATTSYNNPDDRTTGRKPVPQSLFCNGWPELSIK